MKSQLFFPIGAKVDICCQPADAISPGYCRELACLTSSQCTFQGFGDLQNQIHFIDQIIRFRRNELKCQFITSLGLECCPYFWRCSSGGSNEDVKSFHIHFSLYLKFETLWINVCNFGFQITQNAFRASKLSLLWHRHSE